MSNSEHSIEAELATLDKLMDQTTSTSLLNTPETMDNLTSTPVQPVPKKRKVNLSGNERSFTTEMDQAFADFNQTVAEIYRKHDMTSQAAWNASKRIMILRQKLDTKTEVDKLV